jgi:predicted transcriptional regulator
MGKTTRHQQAIYLDHDKAKLLDKLAAQTRLPKQVLMRDAVDLLLIQHGLLKVPKRKP